MSRSYWLSIFALGGLLAASALAAQPQAPIKEPAAQAETAKAKPQPSIAQQRAQEAEERARADKEAAQRTEERNARDVAAQERMAVAAEQLTALTKKQMKLVEEANVLLADTANWTLGAFIAAVAAAGAAIAAVLYARSSDQHELRAYIGVSPIKWEIIPPDLLTGSKRTFSARVKMVNHGQTPARKYSYSGDVLYVPVKSKSPSWEIVSSHIHWTDSSLNPGHEQGFSPFLETEFTVPMQDAIEAGNANLFVYGRVAYTDVFSKTERRSLFRFKIGKGQIHKSDSFVHCDDGNDAN